MTARCGTIARMSLGLVVAMALAGCAPGPGAAQAPTWTPFPTATPFPTHAPSPTPPPEPTISSDGPGSPHPCYGTTGWTPSGDLAISKPNVLYGFSADYMLPDATPPDKPLAIVTVQQSGGYTLGSPIEARPVVQGSFVITVCNTSHTQAHKLTSFGVMLDSLTAYSGKLNSLNACAFLYGKPDGIGGECDTGYSPDVELQFKFPGSAAVSATATQAAPRSLELAPGYELDIAYEFSALASPAIAVYRLGIGMDGGAVRYPATLKTQPSANATIAVHWSGDYCNTSQMQAQIPATTPANTYYACPNL